MFGEGFPESGFEFPGFSGVEEVELSEGRPGISQESFSALIGDEVNEGFDFGVFGQFQFN